jgi:hypothetical protein
MCQPASSLGIALDSAISAFGDNPEFLLAFARIASYTMECHFGTSRGTLNSDARSKELFRTEIDMAMIQRFMLELSLHPYIRRCQTEAGCSLDPAQPESVEVVFTDTIAKIDKECACLANNDTAKLFHSNPRTFITHFWSSRSLLLP